jgi:trigger factor
MKLEMTELGPVKRALKIEVPEEAVKSEFQKVYAELKRQVRIPGFRPGKAPLEILQKRYGQMVGQDVVQRLVPDYYQRAVKESGVVPVVVDIPPLDRMKVEPNSSFTFTATVEIKPSIQLGDPDLAQTTGSAGCRFGRDRTSRWSLCGAYRRRVCG